MKKRLHLILVAAVVIAALIIWGFIRGHEERDREQAREQAVTVPLRVENGANGTLVVFDSATQKRAGIAVATAKPVTRQADIDALATVLPPQGLIELRNRYVSVSAQADKARAVLHASRREYIRLKALHGDNRNISDRVLQAAAVILRRDEAALDIARAAAKAFKYDARQKWGTPLTAAVMKNTASFQSLLRRKNLLLRVAAPSGVYLSSPPATIAVVRDGGRPAKAQFISRSPQADPHIQGSAFFYIAAAAGLLPGTTQTARLAVGPEETGAIIPATAVVWWQGKRWFYVQKAPGRFMRRDLVAALPVTNGWFVPQLQSLPVVVTGAQMLLSEELRSQIPAGDDD